MVGVEIIKKRGCTCDKTWCSRLADPGDTRECTYCFSLERSYPCPKGGPQPAAKPARVRPRRRDGS